MFEVAHTFRHARTANFSSISFFSYSAPPPSSAKQSRQQQQQQHQQPSFLIAGDVDGFVHIFSLRSMRQVSMINVAEQRAVLFFGSASGGCSTKLFEKLQTPKVPHGILGAGIATVQTTQEQQQQQQQCLLLWAQSRTMAISVFRATGALLGLEEEEEEEESSSDDAEDDTHCFASVDDEETADADFSTITTPALVVLEGIRNFSFAPAICIEHRGSSVFFLCPHEADIITNYETGERGTAPALKVFGLALLRTDASSHSSSSKSAAALETRVDMCFDDEGAFGSTLGQIMTMTTANTGLTSSSAAKHLLAVGAEAGFVVLLQLDLDALLQPMAAIHSGAVPFQLLARIRVAVDPVMSLAILPTTSSSCNSSCNEGRTRTGPVVCCGTAEGTVCTIAFRSSCGANLAAASPKIWSTRLAGGVGHLVATAAAATAAARAAPTETASNAKAEEGASVLLVTAFLWNGDVISMKRAEAPPALAPPPSAAVAATPLSQTDEEYFRLAPDHTTSVSRIFASSPFDSVSATTGSAVVATVVKSSASTAVLAVCSSEAASVVRNLRRIVAPKVFLSEPSKRSQEDTSGAAMAVFAFSNKSGLLQLAMAVR